VSNLHRLRLTDRIFFVNVNLELQQLRLGQGTVAACPTQIDYAFLPVGYQA
jgi:hypothetical protein